MRTCTELECGVTSGLSVLGNVYMVRFEIFWQNLSKTLGWFFFFFFRKRFACVKSFGFRGERVLFQVNISDGGSFSTKWRNNVVVIYARGFEQHNKRCVRAWVLLPLLLILHVIFLDGFSLHTCFAHSSATCVSLPCFIHRAIGTYTIEQSAIKSPEEFSQWRNECSYGLRRRDRTKSRDSERTRAMPDFIAVLLWLLLHCTFQNYFLSRKAYWWCGVYVRRCNMMGKPTFPQFSFYYIPMWAHKNTRVVNRHKNFDTSIF